jgi:hypothetical protein
LSGNWYDIVGQPSLPEAYAVTGGGSYCQGGGGLPVGVANSEIGVTYTITPGGETVAGTGSAITFGNRSAGTYTVSGTNTAGTTTMTGSAVIIENPLPVAGITNNDGTTVLTCTKTAINVTATGGETYSWDHSLGSNANVNLTSADTIQ